jgi:hypothetical protein
VGTGILRGKMGIACWAGKDSDAAYTKGFKDDSFQKQAVISGIEHSYDCS